jgi:hypothetical protein
LREGERGEEQAADEGKPGEEFHGRCNGAAGRARQGRTWSGSRPRPLPLINPTKKQINDGQTPSDGACRDAPATRFSRAPSAASPRSG